MNKDNQIKSKAICIIGMHRSGTSTITRAVNLVGAYLGQEPDLMKPVPSNPEGFWERQDIADLDDSILHYYKREWDTGLPLPENWHLTEEMAAFKNKIVKLIKDNFSGKTLWAWKDPRSTLLFEIWREALREADSEFVCLFAVRNPLDVARSLEKRNQFPYDKSFGVWFNYNIAALKATIGLKISFVCYDKFIKDWKGELKRCLNELGVAWSEDDAQLESNMNAFIRPELRHSASGMKELNEACAPEPVIELYRLLENIMENGLTPDNSFTSKIEKLSFDFSSYSRFYQYDIVRLWEREKELAEAKQQLAEKDRQLAAIKSEADEVFKSYSWKITRPLRNLLRILR